MGTMLGFAGFAMMALAPAGLPTFPGGERPAIRSDLARTSPSALTPAERQGGTPAFHFALQFDPPTWAMLDRIVYRDSLRWVANVYIQRSLRDIQLLSGSYASGYWSASGYYEFENRILRGRYTGWVIFYFENGRPYCLEYHDANGECRTPYG